MCLYINIVLPEKSQKYKFVRRRRDIQETSRLGSLDVLTSIFFFQKSHKNISLYEDEETYKKHIVQKFIKLTYFLNLNIGLINLLKFYFCFVWGGGGHYDDNNLTVTRDKLLVYVVTLFIV